ncbi:hypothetical protein ACTFIW_001788 [Dictyostelium discoideum]
MSNHDNNNNTTSVNNNGNSIKTIKENIQACMEIYYHLKSTLGPFGRDKLIVDKNNNYLSTNDGATILQYLKITHPAPRLLIGIAKSQDETVGDGTTSVVLLTCILLQNALKFILLSIHPIIFIKGYQISLDFCLNVINEIKISPIKDNKNNEELLKKEEIFENEEFLKHLYSVASTSISSKILARYSDHFSKIGVEAVKRLKFNATQDLIRVIGITGNSMLESQLIDGILLEIDRNQLTTFKIDQQQSSSSNNNNKENEKIKSILKNPSIIIGKLQLNKTSSNQFQGLNLSIPHYDDDNNNNNQNNNNKEQRDKIELLIKKGINIVISDTEIPQWIELIFKENNILYFNIPDSRELEIISHCINCSLIYDLSSLSSLLDEKEKEGNEKEKQSSMISKPNSIEILSIGDKFFLKISLNGDDGNNNNNKRLLSNGATMLLRSPTDTMLQECIRSFKDMLNILSATVRNPYLIGGGGCTYIELSKRLRNKANEFITDEKLLISINCFADSLEMIPMILIQNAGYDSLDLLGKLKLVHKSTTPTTTTSTTTANPSINNIWKGVNLNDGTIVDMISDLNVKEPSFLLSNILTLSSRAAQMILRINNNIFIEPRSQFKIPNQL